MKRDLDLVRKILLEMESQEHGTNADTLQVTGFTAEQIGFHVYLMNEAGLINAIERSYLGALSPEAFPLNLTWDGYEFLEAARDPTLWNQAKAKVIKPIGGVAFSVLLEWLKAEAKSRLGIP
jgi:hypothetical protein